MQLIWSWSIFGVQIKTHPIRILGIHKSSLGIFSVLSVLSVSSVVKPTFLAPRRLCVRLVAVKSRYARERRMAKYSVSARSNGMLVSSAT
jgi:hypothetical protein